MSQTIFNIAVIASIWGMIYWTRKTDRELFEIYRGIIKLREQIKDLTNQK